MSDAPTAATIRRRAAEAVRHVDQWGHRGLTDLSVDQIEALVIVAAFALPIIGVDVPDLEATNLDGGSAPETESKGERHG